MKLQLFNSTSRSKEEFFPIEDGRVLLYTCGPTVYDYAHIGNLRAFLFADVLRRVLVLNGYEVTQTMNITDVGHLTDDADAGDDKMEKGAAREGKTVWDIARMYTTAYHEDRDALNILAPTYEPHATDTIEEQIALIRRLEESGHTYVTSDGVYFDTSTFADYGKMARLDIEGLEEGARIGVNEEKRNATDFALWKLSPADEKRAMEWDSPWGVGFPGWHIECSAMAMMYMGETIDIHTGGVDHMPIHHTNEIAQSEGATGKTFANWWMHGEFLQVDGGKMSKSLGNFYRLADIFERGYSAMDFRYMMLSGHYRSKLNFTFDSLDSARTARENLIAIIAQWESELIGGIVIDEDNIAEDYYNKIFWALNDDLNTPKALSIVWEMIKLKDDDITVATTLYSPPSKEQRANTLYKLDKAVFGLGLEESVRSYMNVTETGMAVMEEKLAAREKARAEKDFETADKLRDEIEAAGFVIEDTDEGAKLKPKN